MTEWKRRILAAIGALCLAAALPASGYAQQLYGSITGVVTDESGLAIPGATVSIVNTQTGLERTTVSNETGTYSFTNVLPGSYDVKVSLQGFREFNRTGVPVSVGTVSRVDVELSVGALTETITVQSEARLLQTDRADVSTQLRSEEIQNLPLAQYRNYQSLMNLVPGATPTQFQNALTDTPARSLRTFVNGQNPNSNNTKSDGATNVNLWLPHHVMYVAPAETIDTVNISTSNFDAEQGMAGGAAITVITKSGTNDFRGSAFEFFNNDALNARPYFATRKTPIDRNIFGGTLGGPIRRNKLFFFGSYEGYYDRNTSQIFYDVPTPAMRQGDFSGAVNPDGSLQVIYDPLTGNPDGTGRRPFPNNVIPQNRLSPIAQQVLNSYPLPNLPGTTRNFVRDAASKVDRNNYDVKVNWNRTSAHQIWGKYSQMDATVANLFYLGVDGAGEGDTNVKQATAGHTWTLSPTMVLDSTFGFSRQDQEVAGSDFALGNFGLETLGIPGTNAAGQFANDPRYSGFPAFNTGFSVLGNNAGWTPLFRDERTYAISANLTKLVGRHEFRGGYTGNYLYLDHWQPEVDNPRGNFNFNGNATTLFGAGGQTANLYNQFSQFMLGLVSSASRSIQFELMTVREWQHGFYVRDRWTVSDKITLDLGLRYEYYPLATRADRGLEQVDLNVSGPLPEVVLGGLGGNPEDLGIKVSKTLFAPRLGLVYRINDDTVFRTGYGITYNPLPFARPLRGFYPASIGALFEQNNPAGWFGTLSDGIPLVTGPDVSSGRIPLPNTVDMRTPENDLSRGSIQSWNVAIERRLPLDLSIDVAYVGTRGRNGFADLDINASDTPGGGNESRPLFARFGRARDLKSWGRRLDTEYHSLQVALNRPFQNGLLLKGAYTWSKAMNEADEDGWVGLTWNGPSQLDRNWALAGYDRTHVFQLGAVYQLPFGRDGQGLGSFLVRDWQLNGIFAAYSGVPFTITANGAVLNMPGNQQTADQVGEFRKLGNIGSDGPWFDTSAFVQPEGVRLGNTGRNAFRGPGQWRLDLSVFRGFNLGGTRQLEFRAEAFNLTNSIQYGDGAGNQTGFSSTDVNNPNFGRIFVASGERTIRLGLRFSF
ncbi:MAG TPA: TonB-dependent receptor [Vicinamibacterales bacterium]